jgi:hypothetical protein
MHEIMEETTFFNQLPRDIRLNIIQKFDIDARIKTKIISRIKTPTYLQSKINKMNTYKIYVVLCGGGDSNRWMLDPPYNNYLSSVGKSSPDNWLNNWYDNEWPLIKIFFLKLYEEGHQKYEIILSI